MRGGNIDRNEHVALDGTLNGGTVLGHDRETGLNGNKTIIAQRVGLSDVGSNIAIWLAQVGQEGAEECRVALISDLERLLAIWTGLCVCDGFIDDGIRCDTLYVPEQADGSVISGFHSFFRRQTHHFACFSLASACRREELTLMNLYGLTSPLTKASLVAGVPFE